MQENYNNFERILILSDHGSKELAQEVYGFLEKRILPGGLRKFNSDDLYLNLFNNGEIEVKLKTNVRGRHAFVLKSTHTSRTRWKPETEGGQGPPKANSLEIDVNQSYMETFIINDALMRSSAASITNIFPFMPYQRQDYKDKGRVPISASCLATLITESGARRVVNFDPHCEQVQGFYHKIPFDAVYADILFAEYFQNRLKEVKGIGIFSTDAGGKKRASRLGKWLNLPVGIASKERPNPGQVSKTMIPAGYEIKGKDVIIIDDIADSCGSLVTCALGLRDLGAKKVYSCITHPILSCDAKDKLLNNDIELITTNTIPIKDLKSYPNITVISIAYILAETIACICTGESISGHLFDYNKYMIWKNKNGIQEKFSQIK